MSIKKRFTTNWVFEAPDAVLTCSVLKCRNKSYIAFGGHDKHLYLMDLDLTYIDDIAFDGWCRCSYQFDLDGDGCDEILVGAGDGSCLVLKLDRETERLRGIMRYKSHDKINCCVAGDFYRNGSIELIFGGEDKTIKVFDGVDSEEPRFVFYYDSWVTCAILGLLKLPKIKQPIHGLLVGTKNGLLQLIHVVNKDEKLIPEILWQRDLNSQINAIVIGDVTHDGYNEVVISTNDSYIKILNSEGKNLKYIRVYNQRSISSSRPLALLIEDVDGDNAKEIIAGCADGMLRVYENIALKSHSFQLKWKTKVSTSIKDICSIDSSNGENVKHFIFTGYDRSIREVTDFEWGKKPTLKIPIVIDSDKIIPKRKILEKKPYKTVPTDLRTHIIQKLEEKGFVSKLDFLNKELMEMEYSKDKIKDELEKMKSEGLLSHDKIDAPVWSLSPEVLKEKPRPKIKITEKLGLPATSAKAEVKKGEVGIVSEIQEEPVDQEQTIKNAIIGYLDVKKAVLTLPNIVKDVINKGYLKEDVEKVIESLKEQGILYYSRGKPRGWVLAPK